MPDFTETELYGNDLARPAQGSAYLNSLTLEEKGQDRQDQIMRQLQSWRRENNADTFPYHLVVEAYQSRGKHFVAERLLQELDAVRDNLSDLRGSPNTKKQLDLFLDAALDKWDERYDYQTYLAIDLFQLPEASHPPSLVAIAERQRDLLFAQLISDLLQFELDTMEGRSALLPEHTPDTRTVKKRYIFGLKALLPVMRRLGYIENYHTTSLTTAVRDLCAATNWDISVASRRTLQLTMLPVYVVHDEYLFLRILQAFEVTFAWVAVYLRAALAAFETSFDDAVHYLDRGTALIKEAGKLFPLLSTMQRESFQTFRQFTEGASAIQSRGYKVIEALCRCPDPERLDSIAYRAVPEVREHVLSGQATLDEAFARARQAGLFSASECIRVEQAMADFAATLRQWRHAHYAVAVKMLGTKPGTGYTEGTPYLKQVRNIPIFRSVDAAGQTPSHSQSLEKEESAS